MAAPLTNVTTTEMANTTSLEVFPGTANQTYFSESHHFMEWQESQVIHLLPAIVINCLYMGFGLVGNSLVAYVTAFKMKQSITNHLILFLALVQLTGCLFIIPADTAAALNFYTLKFPPLCKAESYLRSIVMLASISLLIAVAVERYRRIVRPYRKQASMKHVWVIISSTLIGSCLFSTPAAIFAGGNTVETPYGPLVVCSTYVSDPYHTSTLPYLWVFLLVFVLVSSTLAIASVYIVIARKVWLRGKLATDANRVFPNTPESTLRRKGNSSYSLAVAGRSPPLFPLAAKVLQLRRTSSSFNLSDLPRSPSALKSPSFSMDDSKPNLIRPTPCVPEIIVHVQKKNDKSTILGKSPAHAETPTDKQTVQVNVLDSRLDDQTTGDNLVQVDSETLESVSCRKENIVSNSSPTSHLNQIDPHCTDVEHDNDVNISSNQNSPNVACTGDSCVLNECISDVNGNVSQSYSTNLRDLDNLVSDGTPVEGKCEQKIVKESVNFHDFDKNSNAHSQQNGVNVTQDSKKLSVDGGTENCQSNGTKVTEDEANPSSPNRYCSSLHRRRKTMKSDLRQHDKVERQMFLTLPRRGKSGQQEQEEKTNSETGRKPFRFTTPFLEELSQKLENRGRKNSNFLESLLDPNKLQLLTPGGSVRRRNGYSRKRTIFIMFMMTAVTAVSHLPYAVVLLYRLTYPHQEVRMQPGVSVAFRLAWNSFFFCMAVHPFVYGFWNNRFKKALSSMVAGLKKSKKQKLEKETDIDSSSARPTQ